MCNARISCSRSGYNNKHIVWVFLSEPNFYTQWPVSGYSIARRALSLLGASNCVATRGHSEATKTRIMLDTEWTTAHLYISWVYQALLPFSIPAWITDHNFPPPPLGFQTPKHATYHHREELETRKRAHHKKTNWMSSANTGIE